MSFRRGKCNEMGKKLISDEAWATVTEGVFKSFGQGQQMNVMTDYAS